MNFFKEYEWVAKWLQAVLLVAFLAWWIICFRRKTPPALPASPLSAAPTSSTVIVSKPSEPLWGMWFRDSSDKYLVVFVWALLLSYNLHILHHGGDTTQLQFVNGLINNLEGAFLTLVTGAVLRKTASASTSTEILPATPKHPTDAVAKTEAVKIEDK